MFTAIASFLAEKFLNAKTILITLVILAFAGLCTYGYVRITGLEAKVTMIEADKTTLQGQVSVLQLVVSQKEAALTECSKATEQARAMAEEIAEKAAAAQALAKKEAQARYEQAQEILKKKPKPGQTSCEAANELLNDLIPQKSN